MFLLPGGPGGPWKNNLFQMFAYKIEIPGVLQARVDSRVVEVHTHSGLRGHAFDERRQRKATRTDFHAASMAG